MIVFNRDEDHPVDLVVSQGMAYGYIMILLYSLIRESNGSFFWKLIGWRNLCSLGVESMELLFVMVQALQLYWSFCVHRL